MTTEEEAMMQHKGDNILIPPRGDDLKKMGGDCMYTPFGPCVGYTQLSKKIVKKLNKTCDDHSKGKKLLTPHAPHLVGKVTEEPAIPRHLVREIMDEVYQTMCNFMWLSKSREVKQSVALHPNNQMEFTPSSAWFVRQYENEYNPIHVHTGCHLSCIGYLKIPDSIEKDRQNDPKNGRSATHGLTEFVYGHASDVIPAATNFRIIPEVGDFYLFPATLQHQVYPFQTKGERRSFSINIGFELKEIQSPSNFVPLRDKANF
tara:strand:+ start:645 stop:1424 length:780 start_codon:yes stop_codon:yes gene_type:complete